MKYIIAKFRVFSSNGSFFTTIGPTRNKNFRTAALFFYVQNSIL